jgi:hypothetical protein
MGATTAAAAVTGEVGVTIVVVGVMIAIALTRALVFCICTGCHVCMCFIHKRYAHVVCLAECGADLLLDLTFRLLFARPCTRLTWSRCRCDCACVPLRTICLRDVL